MNINYEVLFWALFVVCGIGFAYILYLATSLNRLTAQVYELTREFKRNIEMVDVNVNRTNANVCAASNRIESVSSMVEDILDYIEEDDWSPEPDEGEDATEDEHIAGDILIEINEDPIHLITPNQYFFEQGHDKFELEYDSVSGELYYYSFPGDEEHVISIGNITECIGEGLKYFGVNSNDDKYVYIRNNVFHADFRIERVS